MSPEAQTADRVYEELKRLIMSGRYSPGAMIVLTSAAEAFSTSISPVRDALNRLVGDRLVESHPGGGFNVPAITTKSVGNLYEWHGNLARLALKAMSRPEPVGEFPGVNRANKVVFAHSIADLAAELFRRVAEGGDNPEQLIAITSIGARLHRIRLAETLFKNAAAEIETLWNLTRRGNKNQLRVAMWHYHRRRLLHSNALALACGGSGDEDNRE